MESYKIEAASVEINGGCNYSCRMCPQSLGREKSFLKKMPLEVFTKTISELVELGCKEVHLEGSGEPLLGSDIYKYVNSANEYGIRCSIVTNGFSLDKSKCLLLLDNGIANIRFSVIGYDRKTYKTWMSRDAFERVYKNCSIAMDLINQGNYDTKLSSYHMILDNNKQDWEIAKYRDNWIDSLNIFAEIWMMHNWAGWNDPQAMRIKSEKRTCGRPFARHITIRAGGEHNRHGAVVPCCFVLGQDSKAILGHTDSQSIKEILQGSPYQALRDAHLDENFDAIDYCKNCDQLYNVPESLVWTNIEGKKYGQHRFNQTIDFRNDHKLPR